jgi:hypothetical protein
MLDETLTFLAWFLAWHLVDGLLDLAASLWRK